MTKKFHDEIVAAKRVKNYDKMWFTAAMKAIRETGLEKFTMLDLGCGNGEFSEMAKKNFNAEVFCLDYSENHLKKVKELGFKTIKCDFDKIEDINDVVSNYKEKFDVIVSLEVIEHIFDTDALLTTAYNLLKKDGCLIISTPNMSHFSYRIYSMFRGNIPVGEGHHIRFFDSRRLKQALILDGFDRIKNYSVGIDQYYINRAIGEKRNSLRIIWVKTLFYLAKLTIKKSSSMYYSDLIFLAKKSCIKPVGFNPATRNVLYDNLTLDEKKKSIKKLIPLRKKRFFDEHPGLRNFIDHESNILF